MSAAEPNPNREPRVALVTGASAGFGAAIARAFGALGWPVALGARRLEKLEAVAREVEAAGGKALPHVLDVADPVSVAAFVDAAEANLGPVDVVVSNAGTGAPGPLPEISLDELRSEIDTNLFGPMVLVRRVLPGLAERQRGDLVFVTSANATAPRPHQAGYSATKAGIESVARTLQMELLGTGVRSSIVRPGPSRTEMGSDWDPGRVARMMEAWRGWGVMRTFQLLEPEDVARAVVEVVTAPPGVHLDLVQVNPVKLPGGP